MPDGSHHADLAAALLQPLQPDSELLAAVAAILAIDASLTERPAFSRGPNPTQEEIDATYRTYEGPVEDAISLIRNLVNLPAVTVDGVRAKASIIALFTPVTSNPWRLAAWSNGQGYLQNLAHSLAADVLRGAVPPPTPRHVQFGDKHEMRTYNQEPLISRELMERYNSWLHMERRLLAIELYPELGDDCTRYVAEDRLVNLFFHPPEMQWVETHPPSSRAAMMLSAAGITLASDGRPGDAA